MINGTILKTINGGTTWTVIDWSGNLYFCLLSDPILVTRWVSGLSTATTGSNLKTTDGGTTWTKLSFGAN
ncbi:MAG: hypothetical protein IPH20_20540 [Bacteroidales bacterium]|nr:hypothetical protein [Bacteroidales bacterium]